MNPASQRIITQPYIIGSFYYPTEDLFHWCR